MPGSHRQLRVALCTPAKALLWLLQPDGDRGSRRDAQTLALGNDARHTHSSHPRRRLQEQAETNGKGKIGGARAVSIKNLVDRAPLWLTSSCPENVEELTM